jgi:hypothetical protein
MKHTPWKQTAPPIESAAPCKDLCTSLHEAYKKHSAELASLEDRHNKSLVLILGLFGAGTAAVTAVSLTGKPLAAWCFTAIVASVAWVGVHVTHEAHDLRRAVRDLLVRCELAMQFYTPGVFVKGRPLYDDAEREYPDKGGTLTIPSYVAIIITAILLIFLIWNNYSSVLPKKIPC